MFSFLKRQKPPAQKERALLGLTPHDLITPHQAFESFFICGELGSGKTSGIGDHLARAMLAEGWGFCVLCAKPDEAARWENLCAQTGRANDYTRVYPGGPYKIDPIAFEIQQPGGTPESCAQLLNSLVQMAGRKDRGGENAFFYDETERELLYAIYTLWLATGKATLPELYHVVTSAPNSLDEFNSLEFREGYLGSVLNYLLDAKLPPEHERLLGHTFEYWRQYATLSDKTRSIIKLMCTSVLSRFNGPGMYDLVGSGETTITPEDCRNKIVVLDIATLVYREQGQFFQCLFKQLVQRHALRNPGSPIVLWQDEAAQFVIPEADVMAQTVARQAKLINVLMVQSLSVMYRELGGDQRAEHETNALVGNLATKIFCAQSESTTNEWASKLCGSSRHAYISGSMPQYDLVDDLLGQNHGLNFSQQWHPDVPPEDFANLRKGGPPHFYMECIVYQGGRKWTNGKTWIKAAFKQRV